MLETTPRPLVRRLSGTDVAVSATKKIELNPFGICASRMNAASGAVRMRLPSRSTSSTPVVASQAPPRRSARACRPPTRRSRHRDLPVAAAPVGDEATNEPQDRGHALVEARRSARPGVA
jgi:hypothetical protein